MELRPITFDLVAGLWLMLARARCSSSGDSLSQLVADVSREDGDGAEYPYSP